MNYFKSFGYVTTAHAISFANDLKLAHYIKVTFPSLVYVLSVAISAKAHTFLPRFPRGTPSRHRLCPP